MKYREGRHSQFTHLGRQYFVDDLIDLTEGKSSYNIPIEELTWVFEYSKPDESRVLAADIKQPIILIEERIDGKNRLVVLDGFHRLTKAVRLKKTTIPAYLITQAELKTLKTR